MHLQRLTRLLAGGACLLIAGCGGGGSDGADTGEDERHFSTPEQPAVPPSLGYPFLDEEAAAAYAQSGEFNRIEPRSSSCSSAPNCIDAPNYTLQNIHYAHAATLADGSKVRGNGTLIAMVDNGYRLTHQELAGKNIEIYLGSTSSLAVDDHGTAVASIAAGNADGTGIMGVAPEADLHLTSWENVSNTNFLGHLAGATNDARASGAVVQNNSWGWEQEIAANQEKQNFEASNAKSYAEHIASQKGGSTAQWQSLFNAYNNFQSSGVVVFANSNNNSLGDASAWAALPLFVPELSEAWLAVSNARVTLNANDGTIRSADLLSAPCGSAARFCLTSDGTAYVPWPSFSDADTPPDQAYAVSTGTSFAAPQVSGQIALLAQAFPNLSPAEWTTRLLATAQTDWAGFQNSIAGEQTFAPGVTHSYSSLYGHGIPDMKAALSPVGGLSIANGENVLTAQRTSIGGGIDTGGGVIGNSVSKAIAARQVMVIDALGTDFYMAGSDLGSSAGSSAPTTNAEHLAGNVDRIAAAFAFVETEAPASAALYDAAVPKLFFSQTLANLSGDASFSQVFPAGENGFLQFAGQVEQTVEGDNAAFSVSRLMARNGFSAELSLSFGYNAGSFFGTEVRGPFTSTENTSSLATGLSVSKSLSKSWSIGAYAEFGSGFVGSDPAALVQYETVAYASGGLTARRRDLFTGADMIDFYAGVRPTAVAGEADIRLPVGRDADGTIHYDNLSVDLADSDLPMRLGFVYQNRTEGDFDVVVGFNTDFMAGSDPEPVYSVSLGLKKEF